MDDSLDKKASEEEATVSLSDILLNILTRGFYTLTPSIGICEEQYSDIHRVLPEKVCLLQRRYVGYPLENQKGVFDLCIAEVGFEDDIMYITRLRDFGITWGFSKDDFVKSAQ